MATEFQWLQEYLILVDWMRSKWGGKVKRRFTERYSGSATKTNVGGMLAGVSSDIDEEVAIEDIFTLESYPAIETMIEGVRLGMALSDSDMLSLSLEHDIRWEVRVRHEHWADRIFKRLWLEYEFQTGDSSFDKIYFIIANDPSHRAIFLDAAFREMLRKLEPFVGLATTRTHLGITRPIESAELLQSSAIEDLVTLMIRIARFLKK